MVSYGNGEVSEWVSESGEIELKRLSVRQREFWVAAEEKWGIRVDYRYIYIDGIFVISGFRVFIQAEFRVESRIFLIKPRPATGFKKKTHTQPYS